MNFASVRMTANIAKKNNYALLDSQNIFVVITPKWPTRAKKCNEHINNQISSNIKLISAHQSVYGYYPR